MADVDDNILLGSDVLQRDPSGPADLIHSEAKSILIGTAIPVEHVGVPRPARRVVAADHFVIPGMTEVVIDAFVLAREEDEEGNLIVETSHDLAERCQLVMARV